MAKDKTMFVCSNCGYESTKWLGKCPSCGEWDSFKQIKVASEHNNNTAKKTALSFQAAASSKGLPDMGNRPLRLKEISSQEGARICTPDDELNRVLGGGLVPGSLVLLGGEPGIGKSTLTLQTVVSMPEKRILYVSGEESAHQIKQRAERLLSENQKELPSKVFILCETSLENIYGYVQEVKPELLVIDSIQTISTEMVETSPGSVPQVRECAASLLHFAKNSNVPVILIGHINKEGTLAGPKILEHIVDTVIQFEGDQHYMYRILRRSKNRFGSTS